MFDSRSLSKEWHSYSEFLFSYHSTTYFVDLLLDTSRSSVHDVDSTFKAFGECVVQPMNRLAKCTMKKK
jgi:hypothetical protein